MNKQIDMSKLDDQMVVAIPVAMLDQLLTAYRLLMAAEKHKAQFGPGPDPDVVRAVRRFADGVD